jgi:peptidoglycan-N-acetylglucosamine deacetylase
MNPARRERLPAHPAAAVRRLPGSMGQCFLTFDDGPDPHSTPAVLDVLEAAGQHASFFVIGRLASKHGPLLRRARASGHLIGNHSYSHRHPWLLGRASARLEIRSGAQAIADATGEWPGWYRPPHGRLTRYVTEAAREEAQRIALWSVSAVDWGPLATPRRILARLRLVRAGDIVLMHDGPLRHNRPQHTLQVLATMLAALARHGPFPATLPTDARMGG